jgi:hypothetical protein
MEKLAFPNLKTSKTGINNIMKSIMDIIPNIDNQSDSSTSGCVFEKHTRPIVKYGTSMNSINNIPTNALLAINKWFDKK